MVDEARYGFALAKPGRIRAVGLGLPTGTNRQIRECHSFCPHLEREYLHRVQRLQRREADRENHAEDIDQAHRRLGGRRRSGVGVVGSRNDQAYPDKTATDVGEEKERTTADFVDDACAQDGESEGEAVEAEVDVCLGNGVLDAGSVKHGAEEVRQDGFDGQVS